MGPSAPIRRNVGATTALADDVAIRGVDATVQYGAFDFAALPSHASVAPNCIDVDFERQHIPAGTGVEWPTNAACAAASVARMFEQLFVFLGESLPNFQSSWTQRRGCMRCLCCSTYVTSFLILRSHVPAVVSIVVAYCIVRCMAVFAHVAHGPHCRSDTTLWVALMTCLLGHPTFAATLACILKCSPQVLLWWPPKCETSGHAGSSQPVFEQDESLSEMSPLRDKSVSRMTPRDHQVAVGLGDHALKGEGSVAKRRRILWKSKPLCHEENTILASGDVCGVQKKADIAAHLLVPPSDGATACLDYFEQQAPGAWCGMHALNNYLRGPYVTCEACFAAANVVVQELNAAGGGFKELLSNHLDVRSGWLSVDVINVLGAANFNLHVEGERPCSFGAFKSGGHRAAFVNWNNQHWTVLERYGADDVWLHTNSIVGDGWRHGRKVCCDDEVTRILNEICSESGSVALFPVKCAHPERGAEFLEVEGRRALAAGSSPSGFRGGIQAPASRDDTAIVVGERCSSTIKGNQGQQLLLVSLNVDGCGHYPTSPADRMDALLDMILDRKPDIIVLQEVTADMQVLLQRRLGASKWRFYRRSDHSEEYFNLTIAKIASCTSLGKSTSYVFNQTSNGRHLVKVRPEGWTICNVHAESGSQRRAKAERKSQLEYMSGLHEQEDGSVSVLVGDFNLRDGEDACLRQAGWRDAWTLAKKKRLDPWTWKHQNGQHTGRYDRVYIHNGRDARLECLDYDVIKQTCGSLTDHVAVCVVLQISNVELANSVLVQRQERQD